MIVYAGWTCPTGPAKPDIKRAAATAASTMNTAVTPRKIEDANMAALLSWQLANSMCIVPQQNAEVGTVCPERPRVYTDLELAGFLVVLMAEASIVVFTELRHCHKAR